MGACHYSHPHPQPLLGGEGSQKLTLTIRQPRTKNQELPLNPPPCTSSPQRIGCCLQGQCVVFWYRVFMPARFEHSLTVTEADLDRQGHVNNIVYIRWMQDAAVAHSAAQGWPMQRYADAGVAWVVRSHYIEYRVPAFAGDEVTVHTWVADMQRVSSRRKFEIRRRDGTLLARAETNWAFVRTADQRLMRIPEEVASAFVVVTPEDNP